MMEKNRIQFKNITHSIWGSLFVLACISCPAMNGPDPDIPVPDEQAVINFKNLSSYKVDIYRNFNPSYFDPATFLCSVDAVQLVKVQVPPSTDKAVGDTFYLRYKIPITLENTDGNSIFYFDAKTTLANITFVVQKNKTYVKTIPQPLSGQLMLTDGYLQIQNQGGYQIQIENGSVLRREDNGALYLSPFQTGIYKIVFSRFDNTAITVNQLKAFSTAYIDFPPLSVELGKLYHFTVNNDAVVLEKITPLLVN
jgi:hypothetical protein